MNDASEVQHSLHFICLTLDPKLLLSQSSAGTQQQNKHTWSAISIKTVQSSRKSTQFTQRLTTAEASAHECAFYTLIILQYVMQYLVLLSSLFTKHQKLLAAEKP